MQIHEQDVINNEKASMITSKALTTMGNHVYK